MQARIEKQGAVTVVVITGEIDLATAGDATDSLEDALSEATAGIVIDLSSVSYLDSSGVHALFQFSRRRPERDKVIVVPQDSVVRRVLDLVDLASAMKLCESLDEALNVLRQTA